MVLGIEVDPEAKRLQPNENLIFLGLLKGVGIHRGLRAGNFRGLGCRPRGLISVRLVETRTWVETGRPSEGARVPALAWPCTGRERCKPPRKLLGAGREGFSTCRTGCSGFAWISTRPGHKSEPGYTDQRSVPTR